MKIWRAPQTSFKCAEVLLLLCVAVTLKYGKETTYSQDTTGDDEIIPKRISNEINRVNFRSTMRTVKSCHRDTFSIPTRVHRLAAT